jgi:L-histidine N-alpha-methyltransferase
MSDFQYAVRLAGEGRRLRIDVHLNGSQASTLAEDVRRGLAVRPKSLPPKHFYDAHGSRLFDRICETPEYYQTRTELRLLERVAGQVIAVADPTHLVELGSGAAHKTRALLDGFELNGRRCCYIPFDVSESMLREASQRLLGRYPWLRVHGIVGDYDHHLETIPVTGRRLFVFLGSTVGNFESTGAVAFLRRLASQLAPRDHLLLGTDLVKAPEILNAAYNDAQGITAAFNKNVLSVVNRGLDADFDLGRFEHLAFYDPAASQVEMHLVSSCDQLVSVGKLDLRARFERGERMLTEISRKFTRDSVRELLSAAGLELCGWFGSPNDYFALSLSRKGAER